jgi:hypothetical protein
MEHAERKRADLVLSDRSQTVALRDFLRWAVPGVRLLHIPGDPDEPDMLAMLAPSTVLLAAIGLLPGFLSSRRTRLSVAITINAHSVTLHPDGLADALPTLSRLLDDP